MLFDERIIERLHYFCEGLTTAEVAQWVFANLTGERPQMQVQSLSEALIRSLKQVPVDGNCIC